MLYQLHWEWSLNPQYHYGWAVPFLCGYLAWNRARHNNPPPLPRPPPSRLHCLGAILLGLLWLPTRLLQEANPEWRLVSWALALVVLGLTLVLVDLLNPSVAQKIRTSDLLFPLGFFLVAVPWPSLLEGPLIQALSRTTAALTTEILNLAGTPAMQHGNLVEVNRGVIGIAEACSGIRSFQAALMLALFFGELYRAGFLRRLGLVLAGLTLALGLNLVRTLLLAAITANYGSAATDLWHTPLGWLLPLACFGGLALLARAAAPPQTAAAGPLPQQRRPFRLPRMLPRLIAPRSEWIGPALLAWLLFTELGTELWYRAHAAGLPLPLAWHIALPLHAPTLQQRPLSSKAKQMLRFDQGLDATWQDVSGRNWQAIFLCWRPGSVAARLAKDHSPSICLSAAGLNLLNDIKSHVLTIQGLTLRVHTYVATDAHHDKIHVLYCLREDRSANETDLAPSSLWQERLLPALRGRRNHGQRSLELAVWGFAQDEIARAALIEQLRRIVRIDTQPLSDAGQLPRGDQPSLSPSEGERVGVRGYQSIPSRDNH